MKTKALAVLIGLVILYVLLKLTKGRKGWAEFIDTVKESPTRQIVLGAICSIPVWALLLLEPIIAEII
jgi:uncharacterized membrane protein YbhN (UPF0104 family)